MSSLEGIISVSAEEYDEARIKRVSYLFNALEEEDEAQEKLDYYIKRKDLMVEFYYDQQNAQYFYCVIPLSNTPLRDDLEKMFNIYDK